VNTTFNLIAKSNPIIEHCREMKFTNYRCTYGKLEQHLKDTQLFEVKNFWNQVLDFNWHRQDNWDAIPEEEQEKLLILKID
jgi:hypothetical protein